MVMLSRLVFMQRTPTSANFLASYLYLTSNRNFLPGAGKLTYLRTPQAREDIRIETGIEQGSLELLRTAKVPHLS